MLISVTTLLVALASIFRSRASLELENLALRHQIGVLQRSARKRLGLTRMDRFLWVLLSRIWGDWRSVPSGPASRPPTTPNIGTVRTCGPDDTPEQQPIGESDSRDCPKVHFWSITVSGSPAAAHVLEAGFWPYSAGICMYARFHRQRRGPQQQDSSGDPTIPRIPHLQRDANCPLRPAGATS